MKKLEKIIALGMLVFAIGFNLWLYRLEPTVAIDPNDNTFQYALVDRTNQIWDFASKRCSGHLSFGICHLSFLLDHWVPNWAQGYNLPTYYSHIPQILIVASYRFLSQFSILNSQFSLFQYYHFVIYLLLCLFPLSVFLALRVIRLPWLIAGFGALLASHISTDGLYGLDPPSFLWRGYGLTSQLFAMVPLPLAIAFSWRYLNSSRQRRFGGQFLTELAVRLRSIWQNSAVANRHLERNENNLYDQYKVGRATVNNSSTEPAYQSADSFVPAVFFLAATASGHLGLGIIAMLSLIPLALAEPILLFAQQPSVHLSIQPLVNNLKKLFLLAGTTVFILSYWIISVLLYDNYHNISVWDPPWKFNSFGAKETIIRLFNGDLFDFGRLPILTFLGLCGVFACLWKIESGVWGLGSGNNQKSEEKFSSLNPIPYPLYSFAFLFLFFLLLYFGRTTWGGLIDIIPGMREFHLSRFIVGLHAAGFFLIPIGIWWLAENVSKKLFSILHSQFSVLYSFIRLFVYSLIGLLIIVPVYQQTIRYNELNDKLILQANTNYAKAKPDAELLVSELKARITKNSGRIFAGRGGDFGKNFRVAETPYNIFLSTYGIPTVLWLPQTWSPNSDVEQYFSTDNLSTYSLFGVRYVVAPPSTKPEAFWKLTKETASWKLYEIPFTEYFTAGVRPAIVATDKRSYTNVIRLWIQNDKTHQLGLYPELTFDKNYPKKTGLPNFKMLDEVTYAVPDLPAGRQVDSTHNLFREPPVYLPPGQTNIAAIQPFAHPTILSQSVDTDMIFKAKIHVPKDCNECIVVLKQSFHPTWRATIDGAPVRPFSVFPVFLAVSVPEGDREVVFSYEPSGLKIGLLLISSVSVILGLLFIAWKKNRKN